MGNESSVESSEEFNYLIQRSGMTKAGKCTQQWAVLYNILGRSCKLALNRSHGVGMTGDEKFSISTEDGISLSNIYHQVIEVQRDKALDYKFLGYGGVDEGSYSICDSSSNPQIKAISLFYGGESERNGFVFVNLVYKPWAREPYAFTLTHYLALCTQKIDLGLSVEVRIRNSRWNANSGLEFKGPVQHPASALFKMFNIQKQKYPLTYIIPKCPHCEYGDRNSSSHLLISESEDSDNSLSIQSRIGQRMKGLLNNGGNIIGNGNGNMYIDLGSKR
ncbi:hypothetical protein PIB30_005174 [Stylosanthes scabra]|uniref:Uncharacterized protein n=1 Tax=Stylosanthes scabra TaxID=79078 RepID=A0ABU6R4B3_9FABA|nr:hypothetical protein [Stylosanthes scabra]